MKKILLFGFISIFLHGLVLLTVGGNRPFYLAFQQGETLVEISGETKSEVKVGEKRGKGSEGKAQSLSEEDKAMPTSHGETKPEVKSIESEKFKPVRESKPAAEVNTDKQAAGGGGRSEISKNISSGVTDGSELGIPKPLYPMMSKLRGEQGKVLLILNLDEEKHLCEVIVSESSGFPDLDRSALSTVKKNLPPCKDPTLAIREYKILVHFSLK